MGAPKQLKAVKAQRGLPLYAAAKEALRVAIDAGVFQPGEQMPSTKELSEQLDVSLVTAHRALQELVQQGVLERAQGRGTFVHSRYQERKATLTQCRFGLVFHREASLADYYHGQILGGVHTAAGELGIDLVILRFGEDVRNECNGFLMVNPFAEDVQAFTSRPRRQPALAVGAQTGTDVIPSYDVDNVHLAEMAVNHIAELGHKRVGYIGGGYYSSNSRDRLAGFESACRRHELQCPDSVMFKFNSWKLTDEERNHLVTVLSSPERPTAIWASGYSYSLEIYSAASRAGLRIPQDLSLVGVDDPPSAPHLSPPMTTVCQPLTRMGHEAATALFNQLKNCEPQVAAPPLVSRRFMPDLIVRQSALPLAETANAPAAAARA